MGDDQENKLTLALFSGPLAANGMDDGWVTLSSEDDPKVTSVWQTPAAASGMNPLLLHRIYDQGTVRQQVGKQAATRSASSVVALRHEFFVTRGTGAN
ncbi:hypothetical protein E2562_004536 [Oryza meyeriana var. granulata]|uniref:Uncharacterized protein n=1 Tax=Oryza meyeriana var. granulata TaxID=110450 RepID=A0A6G1F3J8_9ORYZ|nr:hypothetical protein E2562_004536 [Oryza meyeriana var. granulata]